MTLFKIKNWQDTFEINRSREIKNISWVAMPNRHDTLGFRTLISRENGPAMYGVWCVLVQVASRCNPRGLLIRDNGTPHTPQSLSIKTGISEAVINECLAGLQDHEIDWVERQEGAALPQEGAALPQEGAALPQEGAPRARATDRQTDSTNKQTTTPSTPPADAPPFQFSEYPKTRDAICRRYPTADMVLVLRIVEASVRAFLSVDSPKIPEPTDDEYAAAVELASASSKKQNSPALYLKTVPAVIENWSKFGRTDGASVYVPPPDYRKTAAAERDRRRKDQGYAN